MEPPSGLEPPKQAVPVWPTAKTQTGFPRWKLKGAAQPAFGFVPGHFFKLGLSCGFCAVSSASILECGDF